MTLIFVQRSEYIVLDTAWMLTPSTVIAIETVLGLPLSNLAQAVRDIVSPTATFEVMSICALPLVAHDSTFRSKIICEYYINVTKVT